MKRNFCSGIRLSDVCRGGANLVRFGTLRFGALRPVCAGRAGVPFEVMGLMLGDFVDEYTVKVVDVFAMPQRGTSMSVEAVDEGYQIEMTEMLRATNRGQPVVGWYHSHPGWDVWLSGVDQSTQEVSLECIGAPFSSSSYTPNAG